MNIKNVLTKKPWLFKILVSSVLIILYVAIMLISQPQVVKDKTNNLDQFSAERAFKHIEQIAQKPHYHKSFETDAVYEDLKEVRDYIQTTLNSFGVSPIIRNYPIGTKWYTKYFEYENSFEQDGITYYYGDAIEKYGEVDLEYEIENYIVEFKGKSDTSILISAHYDSAPPNYWPYINDKNNQRIDEKGISFGAADDGIGVGTILELCRLLKQKSDNGQLENSVKLLINDGEEIGYYGVRLELQKQEEYYKDVSFVINLEARGSKGNAIMFETVEQNSRIIEFYNAGKNKFANSLSTFINSQLFSGGSYTDFGQFVKNGFVGVGFANIKTLDDYHSKNDNISNVSLNTIQQLGNQVYPMVIEFATNTKYSDLNYFKEGNESVYFAIFPNLLISMSHIVQYIIIGLLLFLSVFLVAIKIKRKEISLLKTLIIFGMIILLIVSVSGIALLFTYLYSLLANIKFELINMYGIGFAAYICAAIFVAAVFIGLMFLLNIKKLKPYYKEIKTAIFCLLILLTIIALIFLPSGAHIFSILLFYSLWMQLKDYVKNNKILPFINILIILLTALFYIPTLTEFLYSIAFGGFVIVILIACLPLLFSAIMLNDCVIPKAQLKT